MALSRLKSLKKETQNVVETHFFGHLVVGDDLQSAELYRQLCSQHGEAEVAWLCTVEPSLDELRPWGPTTLRGESSLLEFSKLYPNAEVEHQEKSPVFYKEQKFRPFTAKMKSEPLQWGEQFYSQKGAYPKWEELYHFLNDREFMASLGSKVLSPTIVGLAKITPTDLIQAAEYRLTGADGNFLECQNLYWGRSALEFLNLFSDKNQLSGDFIQFCEESTTPSSLFVRLKFPKMVSERLETLFLPLSYTHEWGHWMGEFRLYKDNEGSGQEVEFLTFFDKNACNEDDLSKKIRLLKRHLEKIFPLFKGCPYREYIKVEEQTMRLKFDEMLYSKVSGELVNLSLARPNGPFSAFGASESSFEYSINKIPLASEASEESLSPS
ncbi:MAG: hypothetical protein HN509_11035 [Halobacteriovoraceae bacterium]|jgi:hypothetical protein|nr:hypothetical protein [Halobacteriovoraceae bacterium]MBT5092720.1 hypothetical protein [Halobacteriovoraceae bacterium]